MGFTTYSDKRFKTDVRKDEVKGLEFITALEPVTYNYDIDLYAAWKEENYGEADTEQWEGKYDIEEIRFSGFLAQDVEALANEIGYDFSGVDAPKNDKDFYGLRYAEFVVPLVKGMQEQQEQIEQQQEQIQEKDEEIGAIQEENAEIKEELGTVQEENVAIREENAEMKARMDRMEAMMLQFGASCCKEASKLESPFQTDEASLKQNIPNPFTSSTIIPYYIPQYAQRASLHFFNETGIEITQRAIPGTGEGQILFTGEQLPAGIYFYSLQVDGKNIATKRMVVLR